MPHSLEGASHWGQSLEDQLRDEPIHFEELAEYKESVALSRYSQIRKRSIPHPNPIGFRLSLCPKPPPYRELADKQSRISPRPPASTGNRQHAFHGRSYRWILAHSDERRDSGFQGRSPSLVVQVASIRRIDPGVTDSHSLYSPSGNQRVPRQVDSVHRPRVGSDWIGYPRIHGGCRS